MADETTTADPSSAETDAPTQPLSGPQQVEPSTTAEPKVTETPSEGEEQVSTEEQREPLPEAWNEHPDATTALKAEHAKGYQLAQGEGDVRREKENLELRATHGQELRRQVDLAQASKVVQATVTTANAIVSALRKGEIEPGEARVQALDLFNANERWANVFNTELQEKARETGVGEGVGQAIDLFGAKLPKALQESYATELKMQELKYQAGDVTRDDAAGHMAEFAFDLLRQEAEKEAEKLVRDRMGQEAKAKERENGKPPAKVAGRAAGGVDNSDQARLDRLALGRDDNGQTPTEADREWLAARN